MFLGNYAVLFFCSFFIGGPAGLLVRMNFAMERLTSIDIVQHNRYQLFNACITFWASQELYSDFYSIFDNFTIYLWLFVSSRWYASFQIKPNQWWWELLEEEAAWIDSFLLPCVNILLKMQLKRYLVNQ